jgi:hypothetical protein
VIIQCAAEGVRTSQAMSKADPASGHVYQYLGYEVGRHLAIALMMSHQRAQSQSITGRSDTML